MARPIVRTDAEKALVRKLLCEGKTHREIQAITGFGAYTVSEEYRRLVDGNVIPRRHAHASRGSKPTLSRKHLDPSVFPSWLQPAVHQPPVPGRFVRLLTPDASEMHDE